MRSPRPSAKSVSVKLGASETMRRTGCGTSNRAARFVGHFERARYGWRRAPAIALPLPLRAQDSADKPERQRQSA